MKEKKSSIGHINYLNSLFLTISKLKNNTQCMIRFKIIDLKLLYYNIIIKHIEN